MKGNTICCCYCYGFTTHASVSAAIKRLQLLAQIANTVLPKHTATVWVKDSCCCCIKQDEVYSCSTLLLLLLQPSLHMCTPAAYRQQLLSHIHNIYAGGAKLQCMRHRALSHAPLTHHNMRLLLITHTGCSFFLPSTHTQYNMPCAPEHYLHARCCHCFHNSSAGTHPAFNHSVQDPCVLILLYIPSLTSKAHRLWETAKAFLELSDR
jgi:hypothetical protein